MALHHQEAWLNSKGTIETGYLWVTVRMDLILLHRIFIVV